MQITAKVTIRVDGNELLTDANARINPGGYERPEVVGPRGVQGFQENPVAPEIEVDVRDHAESDLIALSNIKNATVLAKTDTGVTYMFRRAWVKNPAELRAGDGNTSLTLSAMGVEKL